MKEKLTIEEQVADLEAKGVTFQLYSREKAARFLRSNNYYFKLKSYARNYATNPKTGKYVNLDFAYLVELSTLDMYLRKMILEVCLDIEHLLKTRLMADLARNPAEDGYQIVQKYFRAYPGAEKMIISRANSYCITAELAAKRKETGEFALWHVAEVLPFGQFVQLYDLYYKEYPGANYSTYLGSVKFLRNAAAHSNCLLNSLRQPHGTAKFRKTRELTNALAKATKDEISPTAREKKMSNPLLHDFVALLFVYNDLLGNKANNMMRDSTMEKFYHFFLDRDGRALHHAAYFEKNQCITENYRFIAAVLNYIKKQNENPHHKRFLPQ